MLFKKMNRAADVAAQRIAEGFPMEGSDWIPKDATDPVVIEESAEAEIAPDESLKEKIFSIFRHNKLALVSAIIIIVFCLATIFAPIVAPCDPYVQSLSDRLDGPSAEHWLGTDSYGRDVFSRMLYGGRVSLLVGLIPTAISMVIGTALGLIAGFIGGKVDAVIMRIADVGHADLLHHRKRPFDHIHRAELCQLGGHRSCGSLRSPVAPRKGIRGSRYFYRRKAKQNHHPPHLAELHSYADRSLYHERSRQYSD